MKEIRLIDANALKEAFRENCAEECAICSYAYTTIDGDNLCQLIDNASTVELFCHYQYDGEVKEPCVEAPCPNCERPQDKKRGTDVISYIDGLIDGVEAVRPQGKTNAEIFKQTFGIYATELWSMKEADFLMWLNAEARGAT